MKIDCPFGYSDKIKAGNITFEYRDVNIFADVCDHSDRCKNELCKFFDLTEQGTQRFMQAAIYAQSCFEAMLEDKRKEERFRKCQKLGIHVIKGGAF